MWGKENKGTTSVPDWQVLNILSVSNALTTGRQKLSVTCIFNIGLQIQDRGEE